MVSLLFEPPHTVRFSAGDMRLSPAIGSGSEDNSPNLQTDLSLKSSQMLRRDNTSALLEQVTILLRRCEYAIPVIGVPGPCTSFSFRSF